MKSIKEPDNNDTKSLLEYKLIEDLSIYFSLKEIIDNNKEITNNIIENLIDKIKIENSRILK